ncbi:cell adhesion molecule CEACAM20-like [Aulostomus maculatus]
MDPLASSSLLLLLLTSTGCCAGQDILPDGPVDANVGKTVTLKTLLDKPNYEFIIWNFNDGHEQINVATLTQRGLRVSDPYEGRVAVSNTSGSLTLTTLRPEDSGGYSITMLTVEGDTRTAEIELRVLEPVSNVVISSNIPDAVEHSSTLVLTCSAKGSFLNFTWLNGTAPIKADGKRLTLTEVDPSVTGVASSILTIAGILRTDLVRPIYCAAANKLEMEKSAPFNITIYYGPDEVTFTPANPPKFVRQGSDFNLTCSSKSNPPATFTWYGNDTAMEVAGPVLLLENVKAHGFGAQLTKYKCSAKNVKTQRLANSSSVSFAVMEPITGIKITGPTSTLIAGNSSASISCQVSAGTVSTSSWLKDGKLLTPGARVTFSKDMISMTINPLQKEDNGEYACQVENPVNTEKASYKMVVNFGPEQAVVTGESAVEVRDSVTLSCSAVSIPPANFTWKFNGSQTNIKTAQYTIKEAVYKNTGVYTCEAHNAITGKSSTSTHSLSVKEEGALDQGLSDGAIAGIVIAVLVALGAAIALVMYCRQKVPVESPY